MEATKPFSIFAEAHTVSVIRAVIRERTQFSRGSAKQVAQLSEPFPKPNEKSASDNEDTNLLGIAGGKSLQLHPNSGWKQLYRSRGVTGASSSSRPIGKRLNTAGHGFFH
ncbi:MAG: hypothetical protein AB1898_23470 [Acidobacteriota bacterium]